ncbi:MAG: Swt1 family HEPN domain-containing protein [Litorimonas sp.]
MSAALAGLRYDPNDQALIFEVERSLRHYVDAVMSQQYGDDWLVIVSPECRLAVWSWRQRKARQQGEIDFPLIAFTDFPDLKAIIVRGANWRRCFANSFGDRSQFILAMDCIYAVRKALAHSRPITSEQRYVLECAGGYILGRIQPKSAAKILPNTNPHFIRNIGA